MRKVAFAAAAAAFSLSGAALAHDFVCEKTIDGEVVHEITGYPATVRFRVTVYNTHPTDASTALAVKDRVLESLGLDLAKATPFTIEVGHSVDFAAEVTVHSQSECMRLIRPQTCGFAGEDSFQVIFDGGVAQCAARLVCGASEMEER
jgi:hypothetical protein